MKSIKPGAIKFIVELLKSTNIIRVVLLSCLALFNLRINAQINFSWAVATIGQYSETVPVSLCLDIAGNVISVGYFDNEIDFNPGPGVQSFNCNGATDIYVQKLDPNSNLLWAKHIGGTANEFAYKVRTDEFGNIYVCGSYYGIVEFADSSGVFLESTLDVSCISHTQDAFMLKLDPNGNAVWAKSIGGPSTDRATNIDIDEFGNIYCTGIYYESADFDPSAATYTLSTGSTGSAFFIAKYNNNGDFIWAKDYIPGATGSNSYKNGLAIDLNNNVIFSQKLFGTMDLDPGPGVQNHSATDGAFITKLDPSGNYIWAKSFSETNTLDLCVDKSDKIYVCGSFLNTNDFDPGTGIYNLTALGLFDCFILKLNENGNFVWANSIGTPGVDNFYTVATDEHDNVYTIGTFMNYSWPAGTLIDVAPGPAVDNLALIGYEDAFVRSLDSNGVYRWGYITGGSYMDFGYAIAIDSDNNIITTGNYQISADFDPGTSVFTLTTPSGNMQAFTQKLSQTIVLSNENTSISESEMMKIWPNPCSTQLTISLKENSLVEVISINGEIVLTNELAEGIHLLKLDGIASGVYVLHLISGDKRNTFRIVKE